MTTKMTQRDKKLLLLLAMFLIVVGSALLLIMPALEKREELELSIEEANLSKDDMDTKLAMLPVNETALKSSQEKWEETSKDFYPIMESQAIDKLMTSAILNSGLTSKNMEITVSQEPVDLEYYYASKAGFLDGGIDTGTDAGTATETEVGAEVEKTAEKLTSQMYVATVSMIVEGPEANTRVLVDSMSNDYPAVRVMSVSYTPLKENIQTEEVAVGNDGETELQQVVSNGGVSLQLNLELYMCSK